ncbi:ABC transporter ATP-binding protein [Ornithinimicrobium cerasi]|uniref:ABC transporter ATP-binding protein n=1 Tax=Ornithinimicrobium cerasi TaxID=2248773 RepID=UPI000EFFC3F8|nr:ABC transporter ATP-binding protein [Ornithinimicrobium cerasi]
MTTTKLRHQDLPTTQDTTVLAELVGASKQYGQGAATVRAVCGLDLQVRSGELLAILGPNGAGKSTAIGMLTGLTTPSSGMARLFGRDPRDLRARRRLGAMLQASGVPDTLRVRELLAGFRAYYPDPLPIAQVISAAGLEGLEDRMFGELSGGQQRRVLFGITLAGDPDLLMFDEPTTGLDAESRRGLWTTLRELARSGRGVVLTTHYLEEADALADRIVVIDRGVAIAEGTPAEIKARVPGRRVRAQTTVSVTEADRWPGVTRASREGPWLDLLVVSAEPALRALLHLDPRAADVTVTEPSLEEAFLTLTSDMEAAS